MVDTTQPIYASSALVFVLSKDIYTFFATGSDLLPLAAPGGTDTFKLYGVKDNYPSAATIQFTRDLATVTQLGRALQQRAAFGGAIGRRRHRVLHHDHSRRCPRRAPISPRSSMR